MKLKKRICEWDEAVRMIKDGTFGEFLQSWLDRYERIGRDGWMQALKEYKQANRCELKEAKTMVDMLMYCPRPLDLDLEIGPDYILRREGGNYSLYVRINGIWAMYGDNVKLEHLPGMLRNPAKVKWESLCDKRQLMRVGRARRLESLARELWLRVKVRKWDGNDCLLFCDDEIWREEDGWIRIAHKGGFERIPATIAAVKEHLQKHYERLDPTRGPF